MVKSTKQHGLTLPMSLASLLVVQPHPHITMKTIKIYFTASIMLLAGSAICQANTELLNVSFDSAADINAFDQVTGINSLTIDTNNIFGTGDSMLYSQGSSVNLLAFNFDQVALQAPGDHLTVSFSYRWVNVGTGNTVDAPSFGFYNDSSTPTTYTDDYGYLGRNAGSSIGLYTESGGNNFSIAGTDISGPQASKSGAYDGSIRTMTFSLTRVADTNSDLLDDLQVTMSYDTSSVVYTYTTAPEFAFDYFALRTRNDAYIDNVLITTNIPEPSSSGVILSLTSVVAIFLLRRRR